LWLGDSRGDARHFIAQVSPFGFSWPFNVRGSIVALLFDIIDLRRAHTAFEFMWTAVCVRCIHRLGPRELACREVVDPTEHD